MMGQIKAFTLLGRAAARPNSRRASGGQRRGRAQVVVLVRKDVLVLFGFAGEFGLISRAGRFQELGSKLLKRPILGVTKIDV